MSFATDVAAFRAGNNTDITTKTAPNSIPPTVVGSYFDQTGALLLELDALVGASGNLQAVTDLGNTTTDTIETNGGAFLAIDPVYAGYISVAARNIEFHSTGTPNATIALGGITANRGYLLPDEGTGSGTASTIVLHSTKDPILVTDPTTSDVTKMSGVEFTAGDLAGNQFSAGPSFSQVASPIVSTNGTILINLSDRLRFKQIAGAGNKQADIVAPTTLTSNHTYTLPDFSAAFLMNTTAASTQSLSGATSIVIPHGQPFTPSMAIPVAMNANAGGALIGSWISLIDATNVTISFATPITGICNFKLQLIP